MDESDKTLNSFSMLEKSSTIPRDVETAFAERLGISKGLTATITYVKTVTQDGGTKIITVTSGTLIFTNGVLTASA